MTLLVYGRPISKNELHVSTLYKKRIRDAYLKRFENSIMFAEGSVNLKLTFCYAVDQSTPESRLHEAHNIPRTDKAPNLVISALTGLIFSSSSQVNPLSVMRIRRSPEALELEYGFEAKEGYTKIEWSA